MRYLLIAIALLLASPAMAQNPVAKRIIGAGAENVTDGVAPKGVPKDLLGALDDKLLPDLIYAKAMADANNVVITSNCYGAWIEIIQNRQKALKNPDGTPLTPPDPHLITDFERNFELIQALKPDSKFSIACSPVANMIKSDVLGLISKVVAGGAGLSLLGIGL